MPPESDAVSPSVDVATHVETEPFVWSTMPFVPSELVESRSDERRTFVAKRFVDDAFVELLLVKIEFVPEIAVVDAKVRKVLPETVRAELEAKVMVEEAAVTLPVKYPSPCTVRRRDGVVVPMPTFTASSLTPPRTKQFEQPTRAFLPIAVMLVRTVVEATALSREA